MSTQTNITEFIRGEHHSDYTQLSNKTLRDPSLSWKARGLLAYLLSHSPGYHIRADNLHTFSSDGPYTTSSAIKELKSKGYICFHKRQDPQTKTWIAGNWIISEEAGLLKSLTPEKPDPRFPEVRESLSQENHRLYKKDQKERIINKKERSNKRKDFLAENNKFDPEDLPSHLGNNNAVAEAWSRFVQNRKEIKKRITPVAYKMLIKKMLAHSPEEVIAALDTSSERGYTGVFFDNLPARIRTVQGDMFPVKLDPDAQRLADFAASVLGNELIRPRAIQDIVNQMRVFYGTADKFRYQYDPLKRMGPTEHYTWDKFFREWLEFLEEKQASHFELRSVNDLQVTGCRWREYVKRCEEYSCYDWSTGKRRE